MGVSASERKQKVKEAMERMESSIVKNISLNSYPEVSNSALP